MFVKEGAKTENIISVSEVAWEFKLMHDVINK